ncbi:molybdopterin-dependent oxidoreductase [Pseudomonas sp. SWRI92]|uniref:molybdopterin cofactor-binding domain-containing protein n=1 Tax=Pseudomonas sp. SWRI92 TaxID=2745499 RepID=UPI0016444155|nr:molybdopterin cofactor-binding domain-containing protein [Pseudomonas sp. SWRI92]MBC3372809.1 molybdopterin-dependent oxidoreductase [Pseudomonas sp. SWRI92]
MSHPDAHVSALEQFTWQSTLDSNLDRKGLLLRLFAEQRFMAAQVHACKLDHKDYLLSLIDPASTTDDDTRHSSSVDSHRMRSVITEAARKAHWGTLPRHGRAQGIAAHYDAQTCMAVVLDIEVSDEGRLIIHDAVVVADLGFVANPGRVRSQLEGACLMGIAFVTSSDFDPTTKDARAKPAYRTRWPLVSWLPGQIAVHLINPTGAREAGQPSQTSYAPVARALCNAILKATGNESVRIQSLERSSAS